MRRRDFIALLGGAANVAAGGEGAAAGDAGGWGPAQRFQGLISANRLISANQRKMAAIEKRRFREGARRMPFVSGPWGAEPWRLWRVPPLRF
jgi:hypothetical protein